MFQLSISRSQQKQLATSSLPLTIMPHHSPVRGPATAASPRHKLLLALQMPRVLT
jgi:hypothetical protein